MNDQFNNLNEVREYLKKRGFIGASNLVEIVNNYQLTTKILDEAIDRALTLGRKTINAELIHISKTTQENLDQIKKRWGKKRIPLRKLVLWVLDGSSNPSFIILFGEHEIESKQITISEDDIKEFNKSLAKEYDAEISPGKYNLLMENVEYSGYTFLKGSNGHFPSIIDLKLLNPIHGEPYLAKRKGLYREYMASSRSSSFYRSRRERSYGRVPKAATYSNIKSYKEVSLPFFSNLPYEDIVKEIKKVNPFSDVDLKLVDSPNDILELSKDLIKYVNPLTEIISSQNMYKRKKALQVLIQKNPPKAIFEKILQIGSIETISGLFLELAKGSNSILEKEAKEIVASSNHAGGIKKCVYIYLNSINSSLKEKRIKDIRQAISNLELIPESGTIPRGRHSRYYIQKKPRNMSFSDYVNKWSSSEWEIIGPTITFKSNLFTSGRGLSHARFKNLVQEAEIFKLPDLLGKLAHFADTPQFYFLLKNSKYLGFLVYIKRYIRRIIDNYAKTDEDAFITTLKSLFLSYKQNEIVSGSGSRYGSRHGSRTPDYNMILKNFISPPTSQHLSSVDSYYYSRRDEMIPYIDKIDFKYQRKKKDYDNQIEIWNNNISVVIEIALRAQANIVLEFCFNLVRNHPDLENTLKTITPEFLVQLSLSNHRGFSRMFRERLTKMLAESEKFEPELMIALMACSDSELHNQARSYFTRVKGNFTPEMVANLLLLKNLENWDEFFKDRLSELKELQYNVFINTIMSKIYEFSKENIILHEYIHNLLNESTEEFNNVPKKLQVELINLIVDLFLHESNIPGWISTFSQNLIFSLSLKGLTRIVSEMKVDFSQKISSTRFNCIFYVLKAISTKIIPNDAELLDIIDLGTSKTVRTLVFIIEENKSQLKERSTTLLLLFESDMVAFNNIAATTFKELDKKAMKEMLSILIDSPVKRAYSYATLVMDEIYGDKIPKELLIQMLEHGSPDIKSYISDKVSEVIEDLGSKNSDIFIYYVKTLILLPNLKSKSKDRIYETIPSFIINNKEMFFEVEEILLEIGGSNIIKDSERALVALAKIKMVME